VEGVCAQVPYVICGVLYGSSIYILRCNRKYVTSKISINLQFGVAS
jgi:hypothetical protein